MSFQPAPSTDHSVRRPMARRNRAARDERRPIREMDLPPLTEDDDVFIALATIDLLRRLENEPL